MHAPCVKFFEQFHFVSQNNRAFNFKCDMNAGNSYGTPCINLSQIPLHPPYRLENFKRFSRTPLVLLKLHQR